MQFLSLSDRIRVLPVLHGSGDFAVEVRRRLLAEPFDCLAVPLPESFRHTVEQGVGLLPGLSVAVQRDGLETNGRGWGATEWTPDEADDPDEESATASYVPIEPCQPVIAALRTAIQERIPRAWIDAESSPHESWGMGAADPYALKTVPLELFDAAMLPAIAPPRSAQQHRRAIHMAGRLRELESRFARIVFVCGLAEWPAVLDAYLSERGPGHGGAEDDTDMRDADGSRADGDETADEPSIDTGEPVLLGVHERTPAFLLHELPFIAGRYEQARAELLDDESQSVDGVKELLLAARERYQEDLGDRARPVSPNALRICLHYIRNLSLLERRLTPDMYTIVTAARQCLGDAFARHVVRLCMTYPYAIDEEWTGHRLPELQMGIGQAILPPIDGGDGEQVVAMSSRLPGATGQWRTLDLQSEPSREQSQNWRMRWNPMRQCSWPPEDTAIERFRTAVKDHAVSLLGRDLARTEKFTTSLKDGLDIRETLRNWHTGELYVQELPPNVGSLDCVVMLFDTPADPRDYPYRLTWHAEHHDESTLGFFATAAQENVVGPGIALARYGGALFLFPPRPIPEIWHDPRLDFCDTLEERLIAAGCLHAEQRHIALLSPGPPGLGWRRLARRYGRKIIHVPSSRFSQQTLEQLRMFHVLNGHEVRSYASEFIRKA